MISARVSTTGAFLALMSVNAAATGSESSNRNSDRTSRHGDGKRVGVRLLNQARKLAQPVAEVGKRELTSDHPLAHRRVGAVDPGQEHFALAIGADVEIPRRFGQVSLDAPVGLLKDNGSGGGARKRGRSSGGVGKHAQLNNPTSAERQLN